LLGEWSFFIFYYYFSKRLSSYSLSKSLSSVKNYNLRLIGGIMPSSFLDWWILKWFYWGFSVCCLCEFMENYMGELSNGDMWSFAVSIKWDNWIYLLYIFLFSWLWLWITLCPSPFEP
jgi:hypothetical protein